MGLPEVAEAFQQSGIAALLYDPRSTGLSEGHPRNDIDPVKQIEDYSDALSFLSSLPCVLPEQMAIWGMSFAGTVALCAASLDKRAKVVIAVCPLTRLDCAPEKHAKVLAKCIQDRESQLKGNSPFYLPMLNDQGQNPAGFGLGFERENYPKLLAGRSMNALDLNSTTIQTYYRILMWQPFSLWRYLDPTLVMFIVPAHDKVSPPQDQLYHFETFSGPKKLHVEPARGHLDILEGDHVPNLMKLQIDYIKGASYGTIL